MSRRLAAQRVVAICAAMCLAGAALGACALPESSVPGDAELRLLVREIRFGPRFTAGIGCDDDNDRSPGSNPCAIDQARLDVVARLRESAEESRSPDVHARLGVALAVAGAPREGVRWLQRATDTSPANWRSWSDLAAACLVASQLDGDIEASVRALDAASRAVNLRVTPESLTNLALAEARLGLQSAVDTWRRTLEVEHSPFWAESERARLVAAHETPSAAWTRIRARLESLPGADSSGEVAHLVAANPAVARDFLDESLLPRWAAAVMGRGSDEPTLRGLAEAIGAAVSQRTGDQLPAEAVRVLAHAAVRGDRGRLQQLATGHRAFGLGRRKHDSDDPGGAVVEYRRARRALTDAGSPFSDWPAVYEALLAYDDRDVVAALALLNPIIASSSASGHDSVLARALWVRGLVMSQLSNPVGALDDFMDALAMYERIGDDEGIAALENLLADTYRTLGDERTGWRHLARALARLPEVRRPIRRYVILLNASLFCARSHWLDAALIFQNASIGAGRDRGPVPLIEGLSRRALLYAQQGESVLAERDIQRAWTLLTDVRDPASTRYFTAGLRTAEGIVLRPTRPDRAVTTLREAVTLAALVEPAEVPRVYLELSRAAFGAGFDLDGERYLIDGLRAFELQRRRVLSGDLRASFLDTAWELYLDGVQLQLRKGAPDRAFEYSERGRARALLDDLGGLATDELTTKTVVAAVPAGTALVVFVAAAEHMDVWVIRLGRASHRRLVVGRQDLQRAVDDYVSRLSRNRDDVAAGTVLYQSVVSPIRDLIDGAATLALVPDGPLHTLPFAALVDPTTGRYLVESYSLVITPSVAVFLKASQRARELSTRLEHVLVVGNPTINRRRFPELPALPASQREAETIGRFYRTAALLTGPEATRAAFLHALPSADVVHVGAHALSNDESPGMSSLLLAPDGTRGDSGVLFASDVAKQRLPRTRVVVLAACETGRGRRLRGEGVASLARPFLQASVPTVIATLWSISDRATQQVSVTYHRHLVGGLDPIEALRRTQVDLLRGAGVNGVREMTWSAFTAVGGSGITLR